MLLSLSTLEFPNSFLVGSVLRFRWFNQRNNRFCFRNANRAVLKSLLIQAELFAHRVNKYLLGYFVTVPEYKSNFHEQSNVSGYRINRAIYRLTCDTYPTVVAETKAYQYESSIPKWNRLWK